MSLGAIEAIKEAGLQPGMDIKVVLVDPRFGAIGMLIEGDLNATVESRPRFAPTVYEAALKALNGEELPKWIPAQDTWGKDYPSQDGVFFQSYVQEIHRRLRSGPR